MEHAVHKCSYDSAHKHELWGFCVAADSLLKMKSAPATLVALVIVTVTADWRRSPTRKPTTRPTRAPSPSLRSPIPWREQPSNWNSLWRQPSTRTRGPTPNTSVEPTQGPTPVPTTSATLSSSISQSKTPVANETGSNSTETYEFGFCIEFEGPSDDLCSYNDVYLVSKHLLAFIELLLNVYLTMKGLPGNISDIRIMSLSEVTDEDENGSEENDGNEERRLKYVWKLKLGATCKGCKGDDDDQRRHLRTLSKEGIAKESFIDFIDDHINSMIQTSFAIIPLDAECKKSAAQWEGSLTWMS